MAVRASVQVGVAGKRLTIFAMASAIGAFFLQQTLVLPALPILRRDLHTSTVWVTWVLTALLLASAATTPIVGRLGDQFGKRRMLVIVLAVFFVASVGATLAPNIWVLIACRAAQGIGGGIIPLCFAIARDEFPREQLSVVAGYLTATSAGASSLGLLLYGVMVDYVSWRGIFGVTLVPTAVAAVAVWFFVPESGRRIRARVDIPGAVLLAFGVLAFLLALTQGNRWGWSSPWTVGLFVAGGVLLLLWTLVEVRTAEPLVDLHMLRQRTVLLLNVYAATAGAMAYFVWVLVPLIIETPHGLSAELASRVDYGLGGSALTTSLYMLPGFTIGLVSAQVAGRFGRRHGVKWQLAVASGVIFAVAAWLVFLHGAAWQIIVAMVAFGAAAPAAFGALGVLLVDAVRPTETGVASSMSMCIRLIGGAVSAQLTAAILSADTIPGTSLPAGSAFTASFVIAAAVTATGFVVILALKTGAALVPAPMPEAAASR